MSEIWSENPNTIFCCEFFTLWLCNWIIPKYQNANSAIFYTIFKKNSNKKATTTKLKQMHTAHAFNRNGMVKCDGFDIRPIPKWMMCAEKRVPEISRDSLGITLCQKYTNGNKHHFVSPVLWVDSTNTAFVYYLLRIKSDETLNNVNNFKFLYFPFWIVSTQEMKLKLEHEITALRIHSTRG